MPMKVLEHLTLAELGQAAASLGCDVAMVMAVAEVECGPFAPFLPDGRPRILFERHWFHKLTGGKHSAKHPAISSSKRGGYTKTGEAEWVRLSAARALAEDPALMAASWGMFQVLGANYGAAGFKDVQAFARAMHRGAAEHLQAFVSFIKSKGLEGPMRRREFDRIALVYNGPRYREHHYADRMAAAFVEARALIKPSRK
jgi:hypothetical protein